MKPLSRDQTRYAQLQHRPQGRKISTRVLFVVAFVIAALWALFVLHLFRYKSLPGNANEASLGKSVLSYTATEGQYRDAVPGLLYNSKNKPLVMENTWFKLGDLLSTWNPDDMSPEKWLQSAAHPNSGSGIARFDYSNPEEIELALAMRQQELPFIVFNIPDLTAAAEGAFSLKALLDNIGEDVIDVERIPSNKYMYYKKGRRMEAPADWTPPQEDVSMTFSRFLWEVEQSERQPNRIDPARPLHYFTISAHEGMRTPWIRKSLPFFSKTPSLFMAAGEGGRVDGFNGINCRFGMKGVNAANHFDGGRNFVAMVRGRKRYVLLPPTECPHLELLGKSHPSARHTDVDWSEIEELKSRPDMYNAKATEVVLSMGEMLYIPSNWFHYIISQDASIQCNARSGTSQREELIIKKCGF